MSEILIPVAQIALSLALLLVAILCLRLDAKLNALRKGKDGIAQTIGQLNAAVARADAAIKALREHSDASADTLQKQMQEAKAVADGLKFLTSTARALEPAARDRDVRDYAPEPKARPSWEDDDFRPARRAASADSRWSGLR
jgi:uncharacterized membrane protein YccC